MRAAFWVRVVAVVALLQFGGCGHETGPKRIPVEGEVLYDGEPVKQGMISFVPSQGPPVQTPIENGRYRVDYKGGVPAGTSRVEIQGFREGPREVVLAAGSPPQKEVVQYIAPKYNRDSVLTVEISEGEPNVYDFPLLSR